MHTILIVVHLFLSLGLIGLVLMQHGKGADAGAAFGSGASGTVFGASGAANFLSRATAVIATLFFVTSLTLAWYAMQVTDKPGLMQTAPEQAAPAAPAPAGEIPLIPGQAKTAVPETASELPVVPAPVKADAVPKIAE
jgi:preprotein translocase subunit SecG